MTEKELNTKVDEVIAILMEVGRLESQSEMTMVILNKFKKFIKDIDHTARKEGFSDGYEHAKKTIEREHSQLN